MSDATELTTGERTTLSVLAFLYYRMGRLEAARRVYEALAALSPENSAESRAAHAGLAVVALESGDGGEALGHVKSAFGSGPLSTRATTLHLVKAQALWLEGRAEEARAALEDYERFGGAALQPRSAEAGSATDSFFTTNSTRTRKDS